MTHQPPQFQTASSYEMVMGFVHAVDWSEPWLLAVVGGHVAVALAALTSRSSQVGQASIYVLALGIVYSMERINKWAADNWASFASQNYFDANGAGWSAVQGW
ncbi:uncharacterized protein AMSG_01517 [Thecamonas trahens ATCC 50062]|uniref:Uncharacterized protein n=1 Tax=Thecamonas trahens ATCC 50062 TaxID=461836 RepID=A0A0L0DRN3_THETB|nr:hypothetical protein AMSG_01517 [Thecamonas trahens ATCC 50062]KNC54666.1 hypothetical protein AMSG_01517 [Thecamonas trahens ATCC 50062]|eukprot:XP_013761568.1 hypothetical protein AMSG_01517 [Thecamonas trahens ATCC 50062]